MKDQFLIISLIEKPSTMLSRNLRLKCRVGKEQKEVSVTPARVRTIPLIEARDADRSRACRRFSRSHLFTKVLSRDTAVMSYIAT